MAAKRYVIEAHVRDKALRKIRARSKEIIGQIRRTYDPKMEYRLIQKYNSYLIGIHNYYCIATHVNLDIHEIAFDVKKAFTTDSNTDCKEQEVSQTGISRKIREKPRSPISEWTRSCPRSVCSAPSAHG